MKTASDVPALLKILLQHFDNLQCRYYWWEEFMKYIFEMPTRGMIYIQSLIKIDTGVQAILTFGFSSLRACNVGITDEMGFMKLRWAQVP
jgi:hypothetical protein